jgi:hypothetical protein
MSTLPRRRIGAAVVAISALAIALLFLLPSPGTFAASETATPGRVSHVTSAAFSNCNAVGTPTPSALLQPIYVPPKNLTPGGNLSAIMEVEAMNWTSAMSNISVHFPSVYFNFPLANGGKAQLFLSNRSFLMNFSGWSPASRGQTHNYAYPAGLVFKHNGRAVIDSMKIAVQANADYQQITIEVRWQWVYQPHPGVTVHGPWTVPNASAAWPTSIPSIFYPAPYTTFLGSSGLNGTIGTNWTGTLGGDVANRTFFLEMENPAGDVVQSHLQTAPATASTYTTQLVMLSYNHDLTPGPYLMHIHDACGALLWSKTVHTAFAHSATIHFYVYPPASCPGLGVTLNGTSYSNNTVGSFAPSTTAYNFSLGYCPGHKLKTWLTTGAIRIVGGKAMLISYDGTWTVWYV